VTGWIDSHCHLDDRLPGGLAGALEAARTAGVTRMVTVGCDRESSLAALAVAEAEPDVWASVGLHPHEASHGVDTIADLVVRPDVIAIGECGLDYHYDHSPRDVQRDVFAAQIQIALGLGLPLIIHTREAWADTFDVLEAEGVPERTVFHCFTGGPDEARRCLDLGAHLSFSGIVSFPNAPEVHGAAVLCPADRLLVETDSPYLAPVPHRGARNQPAHVVAVGEAIARLRGVDVETVRASSYAAAVTVFASPGFAP
jgi:TatD DNase family protein